MENPRESRSWKWYVTNFRPPFNTISMKTLLSATKNVQSLHLTFSSLKSINLSAMDFKCDRFSILPQELVILIISLLPLVDAFRLCLLRKDWLWFQLWKHCRSIELHETTFTNVGPGVSARHLKTTRKRKFVDFLNWTVPRIMSPALSNLSFQMGYSKKYQNNINLCLVIALWKNVEELSLDFSDKDSSRAMPVWNKAQYALPEFFYRTGKSIRVLSLKSCSLGFCNFKSFLRLKSLSLTRIGISIVEMTTILTSCPVLETLNLVECYQLTKLVICSTLLGLRRLVVRNCESLSLGIELCLPRLEYFEYVGGLVRFSTSQLDDLKEVVLDFQLDTRYLYRSEEITKFFSGFSQARIFTVCVSALKVFPNEYLSGEPLLPLIHVEHFTLKTRMKRYELYAILCLLKSAPRMKLLSISSDFLRPLNDSAHYGCPELPEGFWVTGGWTLNHLKWVDVDGFTGKKYEVEFLKFLLRNSRMLCELAITPHIQGKRSLYSQAFADLQNVERASKCVIIKYC